MRGVNAELAPALRMSVPRAVRAESLVDLPRGEEAFASWLLAWGILPFDRHHLRLVRVDPERGFLEHSWSWLQRSWEHERLLVPVEGGTELSDRVRFEPRLALGTSLTTYLVARVFRNRHRHLRRRFGPLGDTSPPRSRS